MALTRTKIGLLALALAANLLLAAGPGAGGASACSCAGSSSVKKELRTSDAVFSGAVVNIDESDTSRGAGLSLGKVVFDVNRSWKGVAGDSAVVYGQGPGASCGVGFETGKTYLVFAYRGGEGREGSLQTDLCTRTQELSSEAATRMLGPAGATLPDSGGAVLDDPPAAAAVCALLALAGALVLRSRARSPD
jgi:hypothetical protein